ncbi:MAG: tRNA preQ1(34) S-adenosylmethionine ribosyltransferase-isomerase QueA [Myxococcota bacterium]|nr:tRNA preQ1(34) S-adenosylmethionine ribosyltransferase-isomerase QueA [Myxococcota bacterium]
MLLEYDYQLPEELIARFPPERREDSRLLVLGEVNQHLGVRRLPELLEPGDLLVVNDTQVMPARVAARRQSGGQVEVLFLGPGPGPVEALLRPGRRLRAGETLLAGDGVVELIERHEDGRWTVASSPEPAELMGLRGQMPLPPYMRRDSEALDKARYQTVYARHLGAVAAPTAGLHLGLELLEKLKERGIEVAPVTLHVGMGTFRTTRVEDVENGELHEEWYHVPEATRDAVSRCKMNGGRVIAIGTTSARTLESATPLDDTGLPEAGEGVTRLFIRDGYRFRCVDGLLTNFHLPRTSLLMLVGALAGRQRVLEAYQEAIEERYRFYSYGDAMLYLPAERTSR